MICHLKLKQITSFLRFVIVSFTCNSNVPVHVVRMLHADEVDPSALSALNERI